MLSHYVSLRSKFSVVVSVKISTQETMFSSSLPPVVCSRAHVLFTLFVFVFVWWCPIHNMLCFCFVCLRLVYPMLPASLGCTFWIALRYSITFLYLCGCTTVLLLFVWMYHRSVIISVDVPPSSNYSCWCTTDL